MYHFGKVIKITFPKWYTYLDEGLQNSRGNCTEPDCLHEWLDCRLQNVLLQEEQGKEPVDCAKKGYTLPPCK